MSNWFGEKPPMTKQQRELIECMNEFCNEKCPLDASRNEAAEYIHRNIEEYKLLILGNWELQYI